jgi:hypothetical protein
MKHELDFQSAAKVSREVEIPGDGRLGRAGIPSPGLFWPKPLIYTVILAID